MTFKHRTHLHLRFSDMDSFGHINNAVYLTYLEEARLKYLDELIGYGYEWSKNGIIMASADIDFILPAHFRDKVSVLTRCKRIGTKSFTLEYKIVKEEGEKETTLASAETVVVMYDYVNNATIPVPREWKEILSNYDGVVID